MSDKIQRRGDDPLSSYLAFDNVDVRDGAVLMKTRNSLVESTRVEIEFIPTDMACGIERAHRYDMEGRSRSTVRLKPWCRLCSLTPIGDLEDDVGETAAAALSSVEESLKWMDTSRCHAQLSGNANVQSSVSSNGTLNYEVKDRGIKQELDGTPGSYGLRATPKVKIGKFLEVTVYAEEAKEHNQVKEKDEPGRGVGEREGTRVTVDLESTIHLEAELLTSDTKGEIDTSTSLKGTAASRHQLRIRAGCNAARMTCACPPPQLELRLGQPLELGTSSPGEREILMPGCRKGVNAEIHYEGATVPIRRIDLMRWAIID